MFRFYPGPESWGSCLLLTTPLWTCPGVPSLSLLLFLSSCLLLTTPLWTCPVLASLVIDPCRVHTSTGYEPSAVKYFHLYSTITTTSATLSGSLPRALGPFFALFPSVATPRHRVVICSLHTPIFQSRLHSLALLQVLSIKSSPVCVDRIRSTSHPKSSPYTSFLV